MSKPMYPSQTPPVDGTHEPRFTLPRGPANITVPTHDEIARRAYDLYVKSGHQQGRCRENWRQAEQSIRDQNHAAHKE